VFLKGASFKGVQFGKEYKRDIGSWEICFRSIEDDGVELIRREKNNREVEKWKIVGRLSGNYGIASIWPNIDKETEKALGNSLQIFLNNPHIVSFRECRFGEISLDDFDEKTLRKVYQLEKARIKVIQSETKERDEKLLEEFKDHFNLDTTRDWELKYRNEIIPSMKTHFIRIVGRCIKPQELPVNSDNYGFVSFEDACFFNKGTADFFESLFLCETMDCTSVRFFGGGDVEFQNALFCFRDIRIITDNKFYSKVDFSHSLFKNSGWVSFIRARFINEGSVEFKSCVFDNCGPVFFGFAEFFNDGIASFEKSTFKQSKTVSFDSVIFRNGDGVDFNLAKFSNCESVDFYSVIFRNKGDVGFFEAIFKGDIDIKFHSSVFSNSKNVYFDSVVFDCDQEVSFENVIFGNGGSVYFYDSRFNGPRVRFDWVVWINGENLSFEEIYFAEKLELEFVECLFLSLNKVLFEKVQFSERMPLLFRRCYFFSNTNVGFIETKFNNAVFEGGVIKWRDFPLNLKKVLKKIGWLEANGSEGEKYRAQVKNKIRALKRRNWLTPVFEKGVEVLWRDMTQDSAQNITLLHTNLSHSRFNGLTLSHLNLNAPDWAEFEGRVILGEELRFREKGWRNISKSDLRFIEEQYTQLKKNFEEKGNFLHGGDFHYGEQEMRREILKADGKNVMYLLATLYKNFSGFGENPLMALRVMVRLLLMFSLSICLFSVDWNAVAQINWYEIKVFSFPFFAEKCKEIFSQGFGEIFRAMVKLITPFSWRSEIKGIQGWGIFEYSLLILGQLLILAVQTPLLVLSIRRWFKR